MNRSRKEHIVELRTQLNNKSRGSIITISRYKIITYFFNFVFPPYGLYRVWCKKSEFGYTEKIGQSFVVMLYLVTLFERYL